LARFIQRDNDLHILLIPPVINPISSDHAENFIPVGLLVLLSTLEDAGFRSEIYTPQILIARDEDLARVAEDILSKGAISLGFSTWCDSFPVSLLLAEEIKRINPDIPVVFGGPQASILAEMTVEKFPFVDFVLRGEADRTLPGFLAWLSDGKKGTASDIPGLVYWDPSTKEVVSESPGEMVKDLSELPVPAYEGIYEKENLRIDAGRGCPYRCTYCTTNQFFSRRYRVKSPDRIIREMKYCNEKLNVTGFGISHDMFTLKKEFIAEFTDQLSLLNKSLKDPFTWTCSARTNCVSEEMLNQMKESGCIAIFFGIETGSKRIQKEIKKNLDLDYAISMVRHSSSLGIFTFVSYMAGFPGETRSDLNDTLESIVKMAVAGARPQLTLLSILPGTPMYEKHAEKLEYDEIHSGFSVCHLTEKMEKLVRSDKKTFSSFYYLPNHHIPRKTYLFLIDLMNYFEHFLPTMILIKDFIRHDSHGADLLGYIEKHMDAYQYGKEIPIPGLYFLTDSLKKYQEHLSDNGLPESAWDVFQTDFTRAFMIAEFKRYELTKASKRKYYNGNKMPDSDDIIRIVPYWKLIETQRYIYDFIRDPVRMSGKSKFRKGSYHYIILALSNRIVDIIKVPRAFVQTYKELEETTVSTFIQKNVVILGKDRTHEILRKMIRLGLVRIEQSK
jgi:radical SAM superfamily enzyme YgiQ (UPF0313 family)